MAFCATRYHDICAGHRVVGHEGKCRNLHGHNYRIHFTIVSTALDHVGRVIDFSVINTRLCQWLEENWDHKMLLWDIDPHAFELQEIDSTIVLLPFNPTAENIAKHLVTEIGPKQLHDLPVVLESVLIEETRKCAAEYHI